MQMQMQTFIQNTTGTLLTMMHSSKPDRAHVSEISVSTRWVAGAQLGKPLSGEGAVWCLSLGIRMDHKPCLAAKLTLTQLNGSGVSLRKGMHSSSTLTYIGMPKKYVVNPHAFIIITSLWRIV